MEIDENEVIDFDYKEQGEYLEEILENNAIVSTKTYNYHTYNYNGKTYKAEVLKRMGRNNDLALLKIKIDQPMQTVKLGDSEQIKVGQKVLAIGNPFGFTGTLTQGIVSRIDYVKNRIQTDAAINPGSSGGPLLNKNGEIIGINQAIYNPDNNISNIGIGFAIPINLVKEYLKVNNAI